VKLACALAGARTFGAVNEFFFPPGMKTLKRKRGMAAADAAANPVLALASSCTVKDAADFKIVLLSHLDTPACVSLDAANVERIDTAVLQLLCAFVRDRQARGLKVQWQGASTALQEAADLLDLRTHLDLHVDSNAETAGAVS
jgi:ABC-type transporter Mla MlaB component